MDMWEALSGTVVLEWLSEGFDRNWDSNLQHPYIMLSVPKTHAAHLPSEVMAWAVKFESGEARLPAGILAKHYLGHVIPLNSRDAQAIQSS